MSHLAEIDLVLSKHHYSGTSYYQLGLYLGLSTRTLDVIKKNHKDDVSCCLLETLKKWLSKADEKMESPTMEALIAALRELGENAVADGIERDSKCETTSHCTVSLSLLLFP